MSEIVRHRVFTLEGGQGETVRFKIWSAGKLFLLVREFWGLVQEAIEGIDLENEIAVVQRIINVAVENEQKAAMLIAQTIDDPPGYKPEAVLEWDAPDFLEAIRVVVELNREEITKKFQALLGTYVTEKTQGPKKKTKKTTSQTSTTEPPVVASST